MLTYLKTRPTKKKLRTENSQQDGEWNSATAGTEREGSSHASQGDCPTSKGAEPSDVLGGPASAMGTGEGAVQLLPDSSPLTWL